MIKKAIAAVLIAGMIFAGTGCNKKNNNSDDVVESVKPQETIKSDKTTVPQETIGADKTVEPSATELIPEETASVSQVPLSEYEDKKNNFKVSYPAIFSKENTDYISEDTKFFETEDKEASFSITYRLYDYKLTVEDYKDKLENDYDNEDAKVELIGENEVRFEKSYGDKIMVLDAVVKDGKVYQWEMYYPSAKSEDYKKLFDVVKIRTSL